VLCRYLQKILLFVLGLSISPWVIAHEFWLAPLRFEVASGENIQAHIKVGQKLQGETYAFFPNNFERFDLTVANSTQPLRMRFAQSPAVDEPTTQAGLHILSYQSKPAKLKYESPEKFESFLKNEGIEWVLEAHQKRGLPALDFVELYKRYAKSLIKVGDGAGQDQAMGLAFEWVVKTNPYTTKPLSAVQAQLLYLDKPFANAYVVVFKQAQGKVEKQTYRTDAQGLVSIPVGQGGMFLVNAVHMIEPTPKHVGDLPADWLSLWASTTYQLPER